MKIWRLSTDRSVMSITTCSKNPELEKTTLKTSDSDFKGMPMLHRWESGLVLTRKKGRTKDIAHFDGLTVGFGSKTVQIVEPLLRGLVEFLPVQNNDAELCLVNTINVINALDLEKSDYSTFEGRLTYINEYAFKTDINYSNHPIFKISQDPGSFSLVTDEFRNLILSSKLKGFEFVELWDSESSEQMQNELEQKHRALIDFVDSLPGKRFNWDEAVKLIDSGEAVANGKWKLQINDKGNFILGQLEPNGEYFWIQPTYIPPTLLEKKWHIVEKSNE
ncbi:hypothetical protein M3629_12690 [Paenibacillus polysaccharolyticus]|uniref:imm11 family protein n=1 Tax=Paenibacillus polysaccharolyticus TaxID=582692 RepID=UPI00203E5C8F|nr:hypothetical protein [Paenibacillus polysaccharolyticus]MCM3133647.1 hypothetical protein [Paenibacillus polysaccharolyticus]